jgi:hypothetical protein
MKLARLMLNQKVQKKLAQGQSPDHTNHQVDDLASTELDET